jgi:hypothetical protein
MIGQVQRIESQGMAEIGLSGKYYVRNPFGKGNYEYAMFPSRKDYMEFHPPRYISDSERLSDLQTTEYYEFKVKTPDGMRTYYSDLYGKLLDEDSEMEDILELLYSINGRENVSFKYEKCITTNLLSLV